MPSNHLLKARIHRGDFLIGAAIRYLTADRERLEKVLTLHPYDFFHIDVQHAPLNEEKIESFCRLAAEFGVPVLLRIKHPRQAYLVGAFADLGVAGIEVPQVEDEATANEALEYFYYRPMGRRSSGPTSGFGFELPLGAIPRVAYADWWNQSGTLMLQVESLEAITMARRLAKPGVDCLAWGAAPASAVLSFSLEGNPLHPFKTDDDCLKYTLQQLEGTNTRMFVRIPNSSYRQKYIDMGATVIRETPPDDI